MPDLTGGCRAFTQPPAASNQHQDSAIHTYAGNFHPRRHLLSLRGDRPRTLRRFLPWSRGRSSATKGCNRHPTGSPSGRVGRTRPRGNRTVRASGAALISTVCSRSQGAPRSPRHRDLCSGRYFHGGRGGDAICAGMAANAFQPRCSFARRGSINRFRKISNSCHALQNHWKNPVRRKGEKLSQICPNCRR